MRNMDDTSTIDIDEIIEAPADVEPEVVDEMPEQVPADRERGRIRY